MVVVVVVFGRAGFPLYSSRRRRLHLSLRNRGLRRRRRLLSQQKFLLLRSLEVNTHPATKRTKEEK